MPGRLKQALVSAQKAVTKRDVILALRDLLRSRQDEALKLGRSDIILHSTIH